MGHPALGIGNKTGNMKIKILIFTSLLTPVKLVHTTMDAAFMGEVFYISDML